MTNTDGDSKILKTDVLGRVRTPAARRGQLLDEFERSGTSGAKFAELAGLKYQTFASWVQQRRRQRKAAAKSQVTKSSAFTVRWLEAVVARTTNPIDGDDATLPVHLPGGCNDSPPQCSLSFGDIAHRLDMLRECRNSNGDWNGVQPSDL